MALIVFFHLLFGFWFAYRTYKNRSSSIFSSFFITFYVFIYLILLFLVAQTSTIWLIFGIYLPIFTYILIEWFLIYKKSHLFRNHFLEILDSVIARMKMGNSFREALNLSIDSIKTPYLKDIFKELQDRMIYSQKLQTDIPKEIHFAFQTFRQADQDLQPISRLHYIRQALKVEIGFQQKAQKALLQVHLQSFIMIGLYLALLLFSILYYGTQFLSIILISSLLFLIGTLIIFLLGKKIKWSL